MTHSGVLTSSFVLRLAVKVFPLRTPSEFAGVDPASFKKKYLKRTLAEFLAFLAMAPLLIHLLEAQFLAHSRAYRPPATAIYSLTADAGFWYVPASFLGVVLACVLIHVGNRCLLSDGGRERRYASDAIVGFGASKMFLAIGLLVAAAGMAIASYAAKTHFVMTPSGLIIHRMWSSEEEQHPYSDISALKQVVGDDGQSSDFRIEFKDREPWTTALEVVFPDAEHQALLAEITGKRIEIVSK